MLLSCGAKSVEFVLAEDNYVVTRGEVGFQYLMPLALEQTVRASSVEGEQGS